MPTWFRYYLAALLARVRYDLHVPPGCEAAFGINKSGDIAGGGNGLATLWSLSSLSSPKISSLPGSEFFRAINDARDAVTTGRPADQGKPTVAPMLVTAGGKVIDLSGVVPDLSLSSSDLERSFDLNSNAVVGGGFTKGGPTEGFIYEWAKNKVTRIPCPEPGGWTYCYGINSKGDVVGGSNMRAFIYSAGEFRDLGPGVLFDINDSGIAVGYTADTSLPAWVDCNSSNPTLQPLPMPTGYQNGIALAINSHGTIVGSLGDNAQVQAAFVSDGATTHDLNTLIFPSPANLVMAWDINDSGKIVGESSDQTSGARNGFVLTPISRAGPLLGPEIEFFLGGVTVDAGGYGFPVGPIGPWGPEYLATISAPMREILLGLATAELASFMGNRSAGTEIRKVALNAAQTALNQLQKQESLPRRQTRSVPRSYSFFTQPSRPASAGKQSGGGKKKRRKK